MYEERNSGFSFKDFILQVLFVVLFILLLVWLFPTKSYLNKLTGGNVETDSRIESLYKRLYTENLETMKNAAKSYYTDERLPKKVGETKKITLKELLDAKLVLPIYDSNNKECSAKESYVQITKDENEYVMKAYLACSDNEDYVLEYLGCYTYCNSGLCAVEEKETTKEVSTKKTIEYQYKKVTNGSCGDFGAWSDWTKNKITSSSTTKVETKTVTEQQDVKKYGVIGQKQEAQKVTTNATLTCPSGYTLSGSTCVGTSTSTQTAAMTTTCPSGYTLSGSTCSKTVTSTQSTKATASSSWVRIYNSRLYSQPQTSTSTYRYTLVATKSKGACGNCTYTVNYFYNVDQYKTTYTCPSGYTVSGSNCVKSTSSVAYANPTKSCPSGYTVSGNSCVKYTSTNVTANPTYTCPSGYTMSGNTCYGTTNKTVDVYGYYTEKQNVQVTYYRSSSKKCVGSSVDYKWSKSNNDKTLLNQGYALTGKTREV